MEQPFRVVMPCPATQKPHTPTRPTAVSRMIRGDKEMEQTTGKQLFTVIFLLMIVLALLFSLAPTVLEGNFARDHTRALPGTTHSWD
jgi:O-antigen/teichoic acid export membrane protein